MKVRRITKPGSNFGPTFLTSSSAFQYAKDRGINLSDKFDFCVRIWADDYAAFSSLVDLKKAVDQRIVD